MNDQAVIRSMEGRGRRLAILAAALVAVALVVGLVVAGFRGEHVKPSAAALAQPVGTPAHTAP
jgi:hypothetical protein